MKIQLLYIFLALITTACTPLKEIKKIDGSSIDATSLTKKIEALAKEANVAGVIPVLTAGGSESANFC